MLLLLSLLAALAVAAVPTFGGGGGEECIFRCPAGKPVKAQRASHKPSFNGCGSGGFKMDVSNWPGVEQCCNEHDVCYDTCGRERHECDESFGVCLDKKCGCDKECDSTASMLKLGTNMLGCSFYLDSQRQACGCTKSAAKDDL
jgi:secretory phospholipase A2